MTNEKLAQIKEKLQKIAQDIETPVEEAAPEQSPEAVMELVDDAIKILEVAEEAIPAETPDEESEEEPIITAKQKKAGMHDDEDDEKKKKEAKSKGANIDDDEEDEEKKELEARLKTVEAELDATKRAKLAEDWIELYPESQRQAKYNEIVESKETIDILTAKYKVAKEVFDVNRNPNTYKPAKTETGYLFKKARQEQVQLAPWKV